MKRNKKKQYLLLTYLGRVQAEVRTSAVIERTWIGARRKLRGRRHDTVHIREFFDNLPRMSYVHIHPFNTTTLPVSPVNKVSEKTVEIKTFSTSYRTNSLFASDNTGLLSDLIRRLNRNNLQVV